MNNSVDLDLFLSSGQFGKMFWASTTKSSILGSWTKRWGFGWIFIKASNQPRYVTLFHFLFSEMVLNRFPNHQLEIMIDALLIALLYDLELGFHVLVFLTNQIPVVFFEQVCLVHLSYLFLVSYLLCDTIEYFPKAKLGYSISFKSKDSKPFNGTKHM